MEENNSKTEKYNKHSVRYMYTKEECYQESLNYDSRIAFARESKSIYKCAELNEWLNDFPHLRTKDTPVKTRYTKFECYQMALKCKDMRTFRFKYKFYYLCAELNGWLEEFKKISKTKKNVEKLTKAQCRRSAINYSTRSEFAAKGKKYYEYATKHGWLNEICSHMVESEHDKNYWTKENCNSEALKYKSRKDFELGSPSAYNQSKLKGWLDEICSHMEIEIKDEFWTKQRCQLEAAKYPKRSHFSYYSEAAYRISSRNGWLDDICKHMIDEDDERFLKLTEKEVCFNEALKYSTMKEFFDNSPNTFEKCRINKWFNDACKHMPSQTLPVDYWTYERCAIEAKKYKTIKEFRYHAKGAYNKILEFKWKELDSHLRE
jgi:isopentenyldiphosphate isomerase